MKNRRPQPAKWQISESRSDADHPAVGRQQTDDVFPVDGAYLLASAAVKRYRGR